MLISLYRGLLILCAATAGPAAPLFDVTLKSGLDFNHQTGANGAYFFPEITGSGAGIGFFDGDQWPDLYLVQGGVLGADSSTGYDQLYFGRGGGRFRDAGLQMPALAGYGMGVAAGDIDNDGLTDLYVTNYGSNVLLRNRGDGQFEPVENGSTQGGNAWSTSATFFDYDNDGWLDLYVANYVVYSVEENPACYSVTSRRDYCGPSNFPGAQDRLYRNLGGGQFEDVTIKALAPHKPLAGLGVVAADFNNDGFQDLVVANDGAHNHLWMNDGAGRFSDEALFSGVAVNASGVAEASMGVAVGDYDEDGDEDIFLTHLMGETNTLYQNLGNAEFSDVTATAGLAAASRGYTGWATQWVDLNGDGWLDLVIVNGAVRTLEDQADAGSDYPFRQPDQAFLSQSGKGFREVSDALGPALRQLHSGRGAAFGDVDNDGDTDMLINNGNGPARLLAPEGRASHWLGLRLKQHGRDALGTRATLNLRSGRRLHRRVAVDGSFASASDPRVLFRFPADDPPGKLEIRWPNGLKSSQEKLDLNTYTTISAP